MKFNVHRRVRYLVLFIFIALWLWWDLTQAHNAARPASQPFTLASECTPKAHAATTVAIVRSSDPALSNPCPASPMRGSHTPRSSQMVRRAVTLAGGLFAIVHSGDTVLIKPNLVQQDSSGSGGITDVRVVKALVYLIDEIDHGKITIIVGDGSPRPYTTFEKASGTAQKAWKQLFDVSGYQIAEDRRTGIRHQFPALQSQWELRYESLAGAGYRCRPGRGNGRPAGREVLRAQGCRACGCLHQCAGDEDPQGTGVHGCTQEPDRDRSQHAVRIQQDYRRDAGKPGTQAAASCAGTVHLARPGDRGPLDDRRDRFRSGGCHLLSRDRQVAEVYRRLVQREHHQPREDEYDPRGSGSGRSGSCVLSHHGTESGRYRTYHPCRESRTWNEQPGQHHCRWCQHRADTEALQERTDRGAPSTVRATGPGW